MVQEQVSTSPQDRSAMPSEVDAVGNKVADPRVTDVPEEIAEILMSLKRPPNSSSQPSQFPERSAIGDVSSSHREVAFASPTTS